MRTQDGDDTMYGSSLEIVYRQNPEKFLENDLEDLYVDAPNIDDEERNLITTVSESLQKLRNVSKSDVVTFSPSGLDTSVTGEVTKIESENAIVVEGENGHEYMIVVDYEGAHTSEILFYVPYITVIEEDVGVGDFIDLQIE